MLLSWMIEKGTFTSHQVIQWGSKFFYNSANRTKRHFVEDGYLHSLTDHEKIASGYSTKEGVYRITQKAIDENLFINFA